MQTFIKINAARIASLLILSASLAACGGGGGSDGATSNATSDTTAPTTSSPTSPTTTPAAVNHAPTISGAGIASATVGKSYSFTPSAQDTDGDNLTFTISSKPGWAAFDAKTGRLSGTPSTAGSFEEIEITVSDGKASAKLAQFAINVADGDAASKNVTVSWTPPTMNSDGTTLTNLNGYRILFGVKSGVYTESVTVNGTGLTTFMLENLEAGKQYYVVMVAVNSAGIESDKSGEVVVNLT